MNPPTESEIVALHSAYKALTGLDVQFTMQMRFAWENWIACGFTEPDLARVVRYIKQKIKKGKRPKESLLPRNLIQRTDFFGEDLAVSRAEARNTPTQTPRQRALESIGRTETPPDQCRPVKDVLASDNAFAAFRAAMAKEGLL